VETIAILFSAQALIIAALSETLSAASTIT